MNENKIHKIKIAFTLLSILAMTVLIAYVLYGHQDDSLVNTSSTSNQINMESVVPGKTTKGQVENYFGEPIDTLSSKEIYFYPSTSEVRINQITFSEDVVELTKQIVTSRDSIIEESLTNKYGFAKYELYDSTMTEITPNWSLKVYPDEGVAYIGHKVDGTLLTIWRFPSTNIEAFIKNYAPNYSEGKPVEHQ